MDFINKEIENINGSIKRLKEKGVDVYDNFKWYKLGYLWYNERDNTVYHEKVGYNSRIAEIMPMAFTTNKNQAEIEELTAQIEERQKKIKELLIERK